MRVIFLDIDGVLNSRQWDEENPDQIQQGMLVDRSKFVLLQELVQQTDAEIVLHSGWRIWFDDKRRPKNKESEYFTQLLSDYELSIFDFTPDLTTKEIRDRKAFSLVKPKEILTWLKAHPEVEQYVVLDDIKLSNDEIADHQVQADGAVGLDREDIRMAKKILLEE